MHNKEDGSQRGEGTSVEPHWDQDLGAGRFQCAAVALLTCCVSGLGLLYIFLTVPSGRVLDILPCLPLACVKQATCIAETKN